MLRFKQAGIVPVRVSTLFPVADSIEESVSVEVVQVNPLRRVMPMVAVQCRGGERPHGSCERGVDPLQERPCRRSLLQEVQSA